MNSMFLMMVLFQVKHFLFDFPFQNKRHLLYKGNYGNIGGIEHSLLHGVGTYLVVGLCTNNLVIGLLFAVIDTMLHYHIDWLKVNFGSKTTSDPKFWTHLGLDQLAHQLCYIGYIYFLI